ncbi:MAG: cellulase family glycosylhydrolase [Gallionella sp.]
MIDRPPQAKYLLNVLRIISIAFWIVLFGGLSLKANAVSEEGVVSVVNGKLYRDDKPWVPKGVVLVGRLLPKQLHGDSHFAPLVKAAENFGSSELIGVKNFGADLVRFQVSQPGLNPTSKLFDPEYAGYVVTGVKLARSMGFTVLISMQWESGSGSYHENNMPVSDTQNAWTTLIKVLPHDAGIMFELFNEPGLDEVPEANWKIWQDNFQALVFHLRKLETKNVLVVDGLHGAAVLTVDAPIIHDPLDKIVYAIHPYFNTSHIPYGPPHWNQYFGNFCSKNVCLVSEWNAGTFAGCINDIPSLSKALLSYLQNKNIGLVAWAFDYPNTLMIDNSFSKSTNFDGFTSCKDTKTIYGPGTMVHEYFNRFN